MNPMESKVIPTLLILGDKVDETEAMDQIMRKLKRKFSTMKDYNGVSTADSVTRSELIGSSSKKRRKVLNTAKPNGGDNSNESVDNCTGNAGTSKEITLVVQTRVGESGVITPPVQSSSRESEVLVTPIQNRLGESGVTTHPAQARLGDTLATTLPDQDTLGELSEISPLTQTNLKDSGEITPRVQASFASCADIGTKSRTGTHSTSIHQCEKVKVEHSSPLVSEKKEDKKKLNTRLERILKHSKKLHQTKYGAVVAKQNLKDEDSNCFLDIDQDKLTDCTTHHVPDDTCVSEVTGFKDSDNQDSCNILCSESKLLQNKTPEKLIACRASVVTSSTSHHETLQTSLPNTSQYIALDCEFVGVVPKNKSALGRCSIINFAGAVIYDVYTRPEQQITDYRTPWSGIRREHMKKAIPVEMARTQISQIIKDKIVVGHAVFNDFRVLGIRHPKEDIRDTCSNKQLRFLANLPERQAVSLKRLTKALLGRIIQQRTHCSVEDAQATMDLFKLVRINFETDLAQRKARRNQQDSEGSKCIELSQRESSFLDDQFWPENMFESCH